MHTAFLNKEYDKAKSIFENYFRNETDNNKKIQNETFYLYFLYTKIGDKDAIERLKQLIQTGKTEKQKSNPLFWLSACYKFSKNYGEAEKLWISAIDEAEDEEQKTDYIRNLAGVHKSNNQLDKAALLLESRLKKVTTDQEKSALYRSISEVEKERGNNQIAALALEKVIELNPDDKELLFDGAYAQSEADLSYLAINNYDTLITLEPDHGTALNNIGVAANNIDIPTKAVGFYQESVSKGNTLAMANLAQLYLNNGFIEDAKKIIEKTKEHENPHENVSHVITGIHSKQENEKDKWTNALKKANKYRKFIRQYTSAYFSEGTDLANFSGMWNLSNHNQIELKVHKNRLSAEWLIEPTGLSKTKYKCTLSGQIHNNSASIAYTKELVDKSASVGLLAAISTTTTHDCFAYITPEKNEIYIQSKDLKNEFSLNFFREST